MMKASCDEKRCNGRDLRPSRPADQHRKRCSVRRGKVRFGTNRWKMKLLLPPTIRTTENIRSVQRYLNIREYSINSLQPYTRVIRNAHDQLESFHTRPAAENVLCPVEFRTIAQPRILDTWHHDAIPAASSSPKIFGHFRLSDRVPVRILTSDLHHRTQQKKPYKIQGYDFGVQFSVKPTLQLSKTLQLYLGAAQTTSHRI